MVDVAQLVERRIVIPVVVGSIPIVHPKFLESRVLRKGSILIQVKGLLAQLVEQWTLNPSVRGSNP